jgi:hypothetical protein
MTPASYFRCALAAPVQIGLVLLPLGPAVLVFGGIQYLIFAIWMFITIGRKADARAIQKLSYVAPILYLPIQALGWIVYAYSQTSWSAGVWEPLLPLAVYSLGLGYVVVVLVNALYSLLKATKVIPDSGRSMPVKA